MSSDELPLHHPSMTRRLVLAIAALLSVFWLFASGLGLFIMHGEYAEIFDSGVRRTAEKLLPLVVHDLTRHTGDAESALSTPVFDDGHLIYQVRDRKGDVLLYSHITSQFPFEIPLSVGFSTTTTHRIYTAGTPDSALYVSVADSLDHRLEALLEGALVLLLPFFLLLPASIGLAVFLIRRNLAPITTLRDEIGRRHGGDLAPIDRVGVPSELQPIARSVDQLLDRLKAALNAEREFAANSAHELRTPIAGALAQTQRLAAEAPQALAPRVAHIEKSIRHLSDLTERLLQLSRAEAGIGMSARPMDIGPLVKLLTRDIEASPIGRGRLRLIGFDETPVERFVNPDAFAIALRNLIENALLHSPEKSEVRVELTAAGDLCISNQGPCISPDLLEKLTTRFVRGPTLTRGSGLGLSIAERLIQQMQGELSLSSPASGKPDGFEAVVRLKKP